MKASKIVLAVVIIAIAGYIASKYFGARASAVDKKAQWYIKLDKNGDGSLSIEELMITLVIPIHDLINSLIQLNATMFQK